MVEVEKDITIQPKFEAKQYTKNYVYMSRFWKQWENFQSLKEGANPEDQSRPSSGRAPHE
jgi:hypothetical protein